MTLRFSALRFWGFDAIGAQAGLAPAQKLVTLEVGRFIAAGLVLLAHLIVVVNVVFAAKGRVIFGGWRQGAALPLNVEGILVYAGELAVQYFFVLSGFVMMSAHYRDFGRKGAAAKFWWRRAGRIYPAYWLAVLVTLCAGHQPAAFYHQIAPTLLLAPWQTNFIIFPSWSLRFEVAFYLLFGLGLLPGIGKPILALWLALCIWRWLPLGVLQHTHLYLPYLFAMFPPADANRFVSPMEFYFFAGVAAGAVFMRVKPGRLSGFMLLAGGVTALVLVLPPLHGGGPYIATPMGVLRLALVVGAVVLGVAALERRGVLTPKPGWRRFGAISYPLYILHMPVMSLVANRILPGVRFAGTAELYGFFAVFLVVIYAVAVAAARFFDQPVQQYLRKASTAFFAKKTAKKLR